MWNFEPTANLPDFGSVPGLHDAWHQMISETYALMIHGTDPRVLSALQELTSRGKTMADIRFYSPLEREIPENSKTANVNWLARPTSFDDQIPNKEERYRFLDKPQHWPKIPPDSLTRVQDEYCEWVVKTNADNKITKILFTSEPPEYYDFLFDPPAGINKDLSRALLVQLYKAATGEPTITLAELLNARGEYDWYNRHNATSCIHMQQPNNTLGAEINIAARSCILRRRSAQLLVDAQDLIQCGKYGDAARQSDPSIGAAVNLNARQNRFVTLENPVGLYMADLDTTGWSVPQHRDVDPKSFWTVLRGEDVGDPMKNRIVRAQYSVPEGEPFTVSDILIGGSAISHGAQIAEHITMRLGVIVSPPSGLAIPGAIGCTGEPDQQPSSPSTTMRMLARLHAR